MSESSGASPPPRSRPLLIRSPWERRRAVLAAAAILFVAVFVAAAIVAGRFSGHLRRVHATQMRLLDAGIDLARLEDADRLADLVIDHGMRLPGVDGVRLAVGDDPPITAGELGASPSRFELEGRDGAAGVLEAQVRGGPEERAALAMLALQTSVALENQRLLESEREETRLRAALGATEELLVDRGAQLLHVLDGQEVERRHVAHELHEQLAQTLAAVLFALDLLERETDPGPSMKRLAAARAQVDDTLESLRALATRLRPPALDAMGAAAALERLGQTEAGRGLQLDIDLGALGDELPADLDATAYRVAEEAVRATTGERLMRVRCPAPGRDLELSVHTRGDGSIGDPSALRARVEPLGGAVSVGDRQLSARIPIPTPAADRPVPSPVGRGSSGPRPGSRP